MSFPWIQLEADFLEATAKDLAVECEVSRHEVIGLMADLWRWCCVRAVDGRVDGEKAGRKVEEAAGWRGELGRFVNACVCVGLIERTPTGLRIRGMSRYAKAMEKAEKDRTRKGAKVSEGIPVEIAATSDGIPTEIRASAPGKMETEIESKKETKEASAEAAPPPKEPKARKPSAQQDFAVSFEERRKAVLGPAWTEDKTLGAARLNAELDWVKTADRTETADAVTAYLEDPRRRAQDPPCSLLWFSRDRAEYVSKARRQLGLLEPPDTRPPCANCGEVVTTVDIRGRRLCYPCAAAAQLSGAA